MTLAQMRLCAHGGGESTRQIHDSWKRQRICDVAHAELALQTARDHSGCAMLAHGSTIVERSIHCLPRARPECARPRVPHHRAGMAQCIPPVELIELIELIELHWCDYASRTGAV